MSRRITIVLGLFCVVTVLNVVIIVRRQLAPRPSPSKASDEFTRKLLEQTKRRRAWEKERTVPLRSPTLVAELMRIPSDELIPEDPHAVLVSPESLDLRQREDLAAAIAELFRALANNSPQALFDSMQRRHMQLAPNRREVLIQWVIKLTNGGIGEAQVRSMDDASLYVAFQNVTAMDRKVFQRHLLPDASRVAFWRWNSEEVKHLRDVSVLVKSRKANQVWNGFTACASNFAPREPFTLEQEAKTRRNLLFADVELIVGYDQRAFARKAPYLVRYWYNEGYRLWQPVALAACTPDLKYSFPGAEDIFF